MATFVQGRTHRERPAADHDHDVIIGSAVGANLRFLCGGQGTERSENRENQSNPQQASAYHPHQSSLTRADGALPLESTPALGSQVIFVSGIYPITGGSIILSVTPNLTLSGTAITGTVTGTFSCITSIATVSGIDLLNGKGNISGLQIIDSINL